MLAVAARPACNTHILHTAGWKLRKCIWPLDDSSLRQLELGCWLQTTPRTQLQRPTYTCIYGHEFPFHGAVIASLVRGRFESALHLSNAAVAAMEWKCGAVTSGHFACSVSGLYAGVELMDGLIQIRIPHLEMVANCKCNAHCCAARICYRFSAGPLREGELQLLQCKSWYIKCVTFC